MTRRLRVGLLLESFQVPAWVYASVEQLLASPDIEVTLVAQITLPSAARRTPRRALMRRLLQRVDALADRRIAATEDAFATRDPRTLLADAHVKLLGIVEAPGPDPLTIEDAEGLRSYELDVLLWFGQRALSGPILGVARAGVWAFRLGDDRVTRGGPTGFWEVHEGRPAVGAALQILSGLPSRNPTVARASAATVLTSVTRTRSDLAWMALPMLQQALRRLSRDGHEVFMQRVARSSEAPAFYSGRLSGWPSPADLIVHAARRTARLARLVVRRFAARQQWLLYLATGDDLVEACWRLRPLVPPIDRFWADPHILVVDGRSFVFVEELPFATGRGHIAVIEVDRNGRPGPARKALEEPYHLSYPFVFDHDGDFYMIPESSAHGTIDLYRAESFPDEWVFVEHLMTGLKAFDATLLHEHGRWWLFASVRAQHGADAGTLQLFSSDRLIGGEWRLHPDSPLSMDVDGSRPAGAILRRHGRLYRPGQDGSGVYGRAIRLFEIVELTETTYVERLVSSIEPDWDDRITRTHTLAHAGRLTVLDALWLRSRWSVRRSRTRRGEPSGAMR